MLTDIIAKLRTVALPSKFAQEVILVILWTCPGEFPIFCPFASNKYKDSDIKNIVLPVVSEDCKTLSLFLREIIDWLSLREKCSDEYLDVKSDLELVAADNCSTKRLLYPSPNIAITVIVSAAY
jgi:hypothetical protein